MERERRKIRIEIGQATDRGRLPKVFPAICTLLLEQNNWNTIESDVREYLYRRVITSQSFLWWKTRSWSPLVWWFPGNLEGRHIRLLPTTARQHDVRVVTILPGWMSQCVESSSRRHTQGWSAFDEPWSWDSDFNSGMSSWVKCLLCALLTFCFV